MSVKEKQGFVNPVSKKYRKGIAALGMALAITESACGANVPFSEINSKPIPSIQATASPTPESTYNSEDLKQAGCPNNLIGIRNDYPELMGDPKKLCMGGVRIQVDPYTFYKDLKAGQTIKKANELGYSVLCSLVTHSKSKEEVSLALRVATEYPCTILEIGNEVDNKIIPFWEESEKYKRFKSLGADKNTLNEIILDEFTDHFIDIYSEIRKVNPKIQIILGANVDVGLTVRTIQILSEKGVSLDDIYIAAHVYNTSDDVRQRIGFLAQHLKVDKIVVTEVGVKNEDKRKLVDMLQTIRQINKRIRMYIHELSDEEKGFGCRDINQPELDEKCLPIRVFAINDLKQQRN